MLRPSLRIIGFCLLATAASAAQAAASEPTGNVVKVEPAVNASGVGGARLLEVQGAIFMGDEIVSGPGGLAQVRFVDDTRIVIGPNSRLRIDSFSFNPNLTARKVSIAAIKGVFRFISGNSPSPAYSFRTPTMTVGIRGTVFDLSARGPDSSVVFHEGSGQLCDAGGVCVTVTDDCTLFVAPRGGGFANPTGRDRQQRMSVFFPFVDDQTRLDAAFRTDTRDCRNGGSLRAPRPSDNTQTRSAAASPSTRSAPGSPGSPGSPSERSGIGVGVSIGASVGGVSVGADVGAHVGNDD